MICGLYTYDDAEADVQARPPPAPLSGCDFLLKLKDCSLRFYAAALLSAPALCVKDAQRPSSSFSI